MEQSIYSEPAHNISCKYRFTCGAARCPEGFSLSNPSCYIDKFKRYQPDVLWYERSWEEVRKISWREVLSLEESWIYTLIIIIIAVFIFMVMVLIKILLRI